MLFALHIVIGIFQIFSLKNLLFSSKRRTTNDSGYAWWASAMGRKNGHQAIF